MPTSLFRRATLLCPIALLAACGGGGGDDTAPTATLSAQVTELALAVSGRTRAFVIHNGGTATAQAITRVSSGLPAGTSTASTCGDTLAAGASCTVLITPGATPSAAPADVAPTPVTITLQGSNTNALSLRAAVLAPGSAHQGGFVYAIDDDTPMQGSIGGKAIAQTDSDNLHWSPLNDNIAGINEDATAATGGCDGAIDGQCNTDRIVALYPSNPAGYAAGLCATSNVGGHNDWYLPALCELGYEMGGSGLCGTQANPRVAQNIRSALHDNGNPAALGIIYWSSTQASADPQNRAHVMLYDGGPNTTGIKDTATVPVRCVRNLTP